MLVTGAGGFIGSHLVDALLEHGAEVRAFAKYNDRADWGMLSDLPAESQRSIEVVLGDIRDPFLVMNWDLLTTIDCAALVRKHAC